VTEFFIPDVYSLYQNYPNPFNPSTKIKFGIPKTDNVRVIIFNSLGEIVETLTDRVYEAGTYILNFDGKNYASGTYFYEIISGDYRSVKKMNLIK